MEIKLNQEIRNYSEAVYFGLNLRQFVFSILACGIAVGLYFLLKPFLGVETLSWLCILGAAPFAAIGFITYHGMKAEMAFAVIIRSEFLMPKELQLSANYENPAPQAKKEPINIDVKSIVPDFKGIVPEKKVREPKPEKIKPERKVTDVRPHRKNKGNIRYR